MVGDEHPRRSAVANMAAELSACGVSVQIADCQISIAYVQHRASLDRISAEQIAAISGQAVSLQSVIQDVLGTMSPTLGLSVDEAAMHARSTWKESLPQARPEPRPLSRLRAL
jgi:hypothetical protein